MGPKFISFKVMNYDALSIYEYNDELKKLIFIFKGKYDYELRKVFLSRFVPYLRFKYKGFEIVPISSSKKDDEKRGFNHVMEIAKSLDIPIQDVLVKTNNIKQSSLSYKDRLKNKNNLAITSTKSLYGKKVLLIDDVYTSGATIRKAVSLVEKASPKTIKILVVSKTTDPNKDKNKKNIKQIVLANTNT